MGQGEYGRARNYLQQHLEIERNIGDARQLVWELSAPAIAMAAYEDLLAAARLFGAVEAASGAIDFTLPPAERAAYKGAIASSRSRMSAEVFAAAWTKGRAQSPEHAVALALEEADLAEP